MRGGKILLAVALLLSFVQEAINAWRQTHAVSTLVVSALISLGIIALLLWSAFKRRDPEVPPKRGWRIFWIILGWLCALSILGQLLSFVLPRRNTQVIEVNGRKVPLDACLEGSAGLSKLPAERLAFCTCIATTLAEHPTLSEERTRLLERGRLFTLVEEMKLDPDYDPTFLTPCMTNLSSATWTDAMRDGARRECLRQVASAQEDASIDADIYCDCYVSKIVQYTPANVAAMHSDSSSVLYAIQEECAALSVR